MSDRSVGGVRFSAVNSCLVIDSESEVEAP